MKNTTPDPIQPSKVHYILVRKEIKCADDQCGDCREKASFSDQCMHFDKPLKRSRGGRVLRCQACLKADVKGGK